MESDTREMGVAYFSHITTVLRISSTVGVGVFALSSYGPDAPSDFNLFI